MSANNSLYILKIFEAYSDKYNRLTLNQILDYLDNEYDVIIDRRQLYRKFDELNEVGFRIIRIRDGKFTKYYLDKSSLYASDILYIISLIINDKNISNDKTSFYLNEFIRAFPSRYKDEEIFKKIMDNAELNKNIIDNSKKLKVIYKAMDSGKKISYKTLTIQNEEYIFSDILIKLPIEILIKDSDFLIIFNDKTKSCLSDMYNLEIIHEY